MEIIYLPQTDDDLAHWVKTENKAILKKIAQLTRAIIIEAIAFLMLLFYIVGWDLSFYSKAPFLPSHYLSKGLGTFLY